MAVYYKKKNYKYASKVQPSITTMTKQTWQSTTQAVTNKAIL